MRIVKSTPPPVDFMPVLFSSFAKSQNKTEQIEGQVIYWLSQGRFGDGDAGYEHEPASTTPTTTTTATGSAKIFIIHLILLLTWIAIQPGAGQFDQPTW